MKPCRFSENNGFHTEEAVVKVSLARGCVCFPNDKEQDLCEGHFHKLDENGSLGSYKILEVYSHGR